MNYPNTMNRLLTDPGPLPDRENWWSMPYVGFPPLHVASYVGNSVKIQEFLSNGADVNQVAVVKISKLSNERPISWYTARAYEVTESLNLTRRVESQQSFLATPLLTACRRDRRDIVRQLLSDPRIDPTVEVNGKNALEVAMEHGFTDVALELIQDGRLSVQDGRLSVNFGVLRANRE